MRRKNATKLKKVREKNTRTVKHRNLTTKCALCNFTGCSKKLSPKIFCSFLSNRLEFQNKILRKYLFIPCAYNSLINIQLAYGGLKLSAFITKINRWRHCNSADLKTQSMIIIPVCAPRTSKYVGKTFVSKFHAIAGETAKNFRGYFFCYTL